MDEAQDEEGVLEIVVEGRDPGAVVVLDVVAEDEVASLSGAPGITLASDFEAPVLSAGGDEGPVGEVEVKVVHDVDRDVALPEAVAEGRLSKWGLGLRRSDREVEEAVEVPSYVLLRHEAEDGKGVGPLEDPVVPGLEGLVRIGVEVELGKDRDVGRKGRCGAVGIEL